VTRLPAVLNVAALVLAVVAAAVAAVHFTRPNQDPAEGWVTVETGGEPAGRFRCIGGVLIVQMDSGETTTEQGTACQYLNSPAATP
jgi:hypothetical protein